LACAEEKLNFEPALMKGCSKSFSCLPPLA